MGEQMIITLFISIVIPLSMMLIIFDKKTRHNFLFIIIGTYVCIICGSISGLIQEKTDLDVFYLTTTVTPVIEETAKAVPILFYAFFISDDRKRVLAASTSLGLGFALLENIFMIGSAGTAATIPWALSRSFGAGLMHCGCSVVVGYGMIYIRQSKRFFVPNIFAMLTAAMIYHGIFNALSGTKWFRLGPILSILVFLFLVRVHLKVKAEGKQKEETEDAEKKEVVSAEK